jgi:sporulation related protein
MQGGGAFGGDGPLDIDDDGGVIEPEELAFAHEDERLPWLEADDDEAEEPGVDTGKVLAFVIGALVVLGLLLGGLWWYFHRNSAGTIVADGSTIQAPAGPYKARPANPGGSQAVGTGDTSFAVAEGKESLGKVADAPEAPRPSIDLKQAGAAAPAASATPAAPSGVGVQVGAYSSHDRAEAGWSTLSTRYPALSGVSHRILQATVDGAQVFRLQAVAADVKTATQLCHTLRGQGADCQVKN